MPIATRMQLDVELNRELSDDALHAPHRVNEASQRAKRASDGADLAHERAAANLGAVCLWDQAASVSVGLAGSRSASWSIILAAI